MHVAVGFGISNSILLEAPDGLIVVDTTEGMASMEAIWSEFRKISDKPVKGVIYTHSHRDHMGGTEVRGGRGEVESGREREKERERERERERNRERKG